MHSSVTGFLVRVSVQESGGLNVTWSVDGGWGLSGARNGSRRWMFIVLRGSVQSVGLVRPVGCRLVGACGYIVGI